MYSVITIVQIAQMVFAERQLTISGGNFHGEYPAKVSNTNGVTIHILHLYVHVCTHLYMSVGTCSAHDIKT